MFHILYDFVKICEKDKSESTQFGTHQIFSIEFVLLKDITTNCRVTRHLMTMTSRQHEARTETKPEAVICKHN